jgi:hypothetical protein
LLVEERRGEDRGVRSELKKKKGGTTKGTKGTKKGREEGGVGG